MVVAHAELAEDVVELLEGAGHCVGGEVALALKVPDAEEGAVTLDRGDSGGKRSLCTSSQLAGIASICCSLLTKVSEC